MRLLSFGADRQLTLSNHSPEKIPQYVILSHTWGSEDQEVTFEDVLEGKAPLKRAGYRKLEFCGHQAAVDGFKYFWVDTCCIKKSNSTELTEAITSMFKWYKQAQRCYVYLADVSTTRLSGTHPDAKNSSITDLRSSRWFTRGWTLQELIAPSSVEFFSKEGQRLGSRVSLEHLLHDITGIPLGAFRGRDLSEFSVADRYSWARGRETKREEDRAYSLLGIFNVSLICNYGEGVDHSFRRLDEEIVKKSISAASPRILSNPEPNPETRFTDLRHEKQTILSSNERLLELLYFDEIDSRLFSLKIAHSKTCKWFLETEQYIAWSAKESHRQNRLLWIKGKPGVGKSVLMKFLCSHAKKVARSQSQVVIITFFFNARGAPLEKSTLGLYRSLLWQLLEKFDDLQGVFGELDTSARRIIMRDGWTPEIIQQSLFGVIGQLGGRSLQIYIDALDECLEDDVAEMISFFDQFLEYAEDAHISILICFSSRHYPSLSIKWGLQIVLEKEDEHKRDIARYIETNLSRHASTKAGNIESKMIRKSGGIFLWVALVIPLVNSACATGKIGDIQRYLDEIPEELDDLFNLLLNRDDEHIDDLRHCIQWVLFASSALTLEEYYFALHEPNENDTMSRWLAGDITHADMSLFVQASSKGLVELLEPTVYQTQFRVQFIHESVRTFFLSDGGHYRLWTNVEGSFAGYCHESLKLRCLSEIKAVVTRMKSSQAEAKGRESSSAMRTKGVDLDSLSRLEWNKPDDIKRINLSESLHRDFPFLQYATRAVLFHADRALHHSVSQRRFMDEFPFSSWAALKAIYNDYSFVPNPNPLYVFADYVCPELVKHQLGRLDNIEMQGGYLQFPFYALYHRERPSGDFFETSTFKQTLCAFLNIDQSQILPSSLLDQFDKLGRSLPAPQSSPVTRSAELALFEMVEALLRTGKVEPDSKDPNGRTPLSYAAEHGNSNTIKMLLKSHVDPNSKDNSGHSPLFYAANGRHLEVVELLLEGGANINMTDIHGWTALMHCTWNGRKNLVKELLAAGADPNVQANPNGSVAVAIAGEYGDPELIQMLLEAGGEPNTRNFWSQTPLLLAVRAGHLPAIECLLKAGADPDATGTFHQTPLMTAVGANRVDIVEKLLHAGADPNVRTRWEETPLLLSSTRSHTEMVRVLLDHEADPTLTDTHGRTPLSQARLQGNRRLIAMLQLYTP